MRDTPIVPILIWFGIGVALLLTLAVTWFPIAALAYFAAAIVLLVGYVRNAIKQRSRKSLQFHVSPQHGICQIRPVQAALSEPAIA